MRGQERPPRVAAPDADVLGEGHQAVATEPIDGGRVAPESDRARPSHCRQCLAPFLQAQLIDPPQGLGRFLQRAVVVVQFGLNRARERSSAPT